MTTTAPYDGEHPDWCDPSDCVMDRERGRRPEPDSEKARHIGYVMGEFFGDVLDRLEREGQPIPACFIADQPASGGPTG